MKTEVLRNGGYKDDSTTSTTTASLLDDIGIWLNNRYKELRKRNLWPELRRESSVQVPSGVNSFNKPSDLKTIISIRNGTTPLYPMDSTQVTLQTPSLWDNTGSPDFFVQQGETGIRLLGQYDSATTLDLFGKAYVPLLVNDNEKPDIDVDDIIIAGATCDLFTIARPIQTQAQYWDGVYEKLLQIGLGEARAQQADDQCMKPQWSWTSEISYGKPGLDGSTSKVPTY